VTQRAAGVLFALLPALIATASRRRSPSAATPKARATVDLGVGLFSLIKRLKGGLLAQAACYGWDAPPKVRFAPDAPLEEEGFEPSVPRKRDKGFETAPFDGAAAGHRASD
jgi:hypothetical protein